MKDTEIGAVEHVVVLVLENRSFDTMLGYLSLSGKRMDVNGLRPEMSNPYTRKQTNVPVDKLELPRFYPGPKHEHEHVLRQIGETKATVPRPLRSDGYEVAPPTPKMDGFVDDYATVRHAKHPEAVMGYLDREMLWFYDFLAEEYMLCDNWFCAFPGPTHVNRAFLLAGHSANKVSNVEVLKHITFNRVNTIFDELSNVNVSWASYFHDVPALRTYAQFKFHLGNIRHVDRFYEAARTGTLPSVSWIDPNFQLLYSQVGDHANDDHPPADVRYGQQLVHDIYAALASNPASFAKTLFVITYDEHGGFYDHVPPPYRPERAPYRKHAEFDRFGVRVPAFIVSPFVKRRTVSNVEMEHTSIAKTIIERFCPGAEKRMGKRVQTAPSLWPLLEATARTDTPRPAEATVSTMRASLAAGTQSGLRAVGGAADTAFAAFDLAPSEPTELQQQLSDMQADLRGQGMPSGTV